KTTLTEKLTALYLQLNQFDKLIERFERDRREEDQRRDMTICLAQAHHSAGDYGTARAELESLLSQETRDTNLLQQLSKLCEGGSDLDGAIEYQRQLAAIAPGHETEFRLAGLLQRSGYTDEATQIFVKLTRREEDPVRLVASIDSLLKQGSYESVLSIVEPMLSEQRDDWELMYRQGVAWASLDKEAEARDVFQRIATLSTPYEQYGRAAEEKFKRDQAKSKSNNLRGIRSQGPQRMTPLEMLGQSYQVKQAAGLEADRGYYNQSNQLPNVWTPDVYGVARMAAYGWQMKFERQQERKTSDAPEPEASFIDAIAARAAADDAPRDAIYDWMFIEQLRGNYKSLFEVARRLAREGGREEQSYYLQSLMTRTVDAASARASSNGQEQPQVEPLAEEDLELMLSCYRSLVEDDELKGEAAAAFLGGQVAYSSNGQMYVNVGGNWVMVSGGGSYAGDRFLTTVVTELERAGREAEGQELIETRITAAESASELAGAVGLLLSRWEKRPEPERLQSLYDRWVVAARGEITNPPESLVSRMSRMQSQVYDPLSVNSQLIVNWFGQLGPEEEHQQMLDILDPALDLAVEVAKAKRLERSKLRRRTSSTSSRQNAWGMQYQFGKSSQYVQISYPSPSDYVSQSQLTLLRATYEIFKRNDVPDDLAAALERRVGEASDDDRVYEQLMHAYVLWWADRQDEALEVLTKAGESLQDDPQFRLELAEVYTTQGDLDTAMDLVETITPRDQKLLQQREMMAMTLAERLGEIDRARQAAERLFGLRLSTNEQLALGTTMRRLGLMDLSDAMLARAQQRSGNQASSWPLLMAQYQGQGKTELAQQLAHRILQTTQSPLTGMSLSSRNPTRYSNNSDNGRQQALRVLQQTGGLQPLIDRLEGQLAGSPESPRLYEQLIELYQATNNRDKLGETLERAVTARPDAAALQLQLAKHYEQTNKPKQACDAYLAVLKVRPQWIADDLYQIRRVFERAERSLDLAKAFEDMDLRQLGHPYYLIDIVSSLMSSEENLDIAANLFERIVDDFPTYRNQMVSRMHDGKIWKNERIYELGKRMIIPTPEEVVTTPWFGINDVYSYSTGGTAQAMFHRMRDGVFQAGRLDDFEKTIREATDQLPGWRGGRAMLALIALKRNKQAEARGMLEALVSDEEVVQTMPTDACWLIGQELDDYQETRPLALKLFEQGVSEDVSRNQIQYSPIVRLIKIYTEVGRKDDARDILLKNLKPKSIDYYDQDYQLAMLVQNKFWAAEQFAAMGYPLDALTLYQELSGEDSSLSRAASWNGDSVEGLKRRIATGLNSSIEAVSQTDPDAAMSQLLAVPEELT
ncbi:MAG: tetratricopeptide repeat protein, partial [Planctomycetaceae bacterium]|nr:tetratricopeptide repeat protein [Planctomycetaceae bacterium]